MDNLTDCAQGYCEMYCKKYGHCFGDPGDCIFKDEVKMYEKLKSIEGIIKFDRLLELAASDKAGQIIILPCKGGSGTQAFAAATDNNGLSADVINLVGAPEQEQLRWIPVTEKMPEKYVSVLVHIPSESPLPAVKEAYLANGCWVTKIGVFHGMEITHWMPMPEPPKEDS